MKKPRQSQKSVGRRSHRLNSVYPALKNDLIHFVFKPGERLVEELLSRRYRVSRTPVREALRRLEEEGHVVSRGGLGRFVPHFDVEAYAGVYQVRIALEKLAVELACVDADQVAVERLRRDWQAGYSSPETAATDGSYVTANEHFHLGIAQLSGNAYLKELLQRIFDRTRFIAVVDFTEPARIKATQSEHDEILTAIGARDSDLAQRLMAEHIEGSRQNIRRLIARALERIYLDDAGSGTRFPATAATTRSRR